MDDIQQTSQRIAEILLDIEAVRLSPQQPYTWASGIISPIYCDNRLILSYPEYRRELAERLASHIESPHPDLIIGVATGAIAHGILVAERLSVPMAYVRSKAKAHGRKNQIEGVVHPGQECVIIEDLISTGGSSARAVTAVREAGLQVREVISIFSYGLDRAHEQFAAIDCSYRSLCSFEDLLNVALSRGAIESNDLHRILQWRNKPDHWNPSIIA